MKKLIVLAFFTLLSCSTDTPEESIVTPITYTLTVSASEGGTIDNTGGNFKLLVMHKKFTHVHSTKRSINFSNKFNTTLFP